MSETHRARTDRRRRWLVVVLLISIAMVAVGFAGVLGWGQSGEVEVASSIENGIIDGDPVASTTTTAVRHSTVHVTPDQPSAVGVTTMTFTDTTRGTSARGDREALDTRPLTVVIRYPTPGIPGEEELPDAPIYEPAPLVLFAHGFDISTQRYSVLLHEIAAAGFIVAAPEFPMTSTVFDGAPDEYDLPEQARDLSFLISAMTGPDAPPVLSSMILSGPVGLVGHSDGAVTALLTGYSPRYADDRVGAVVAVSGDFDTFGGEWFTTTDPPLLAVHGEYDEINPFESSVLLVDNDPGPAMLVGVVGASHLGAVTDEENAVSVAHLIALNLRWRLSGSLVARDATFAAASVPPLELVSAHD